MYSYEGLLAQLDKTGHKKTDLTTELGLSSRTVAKIAKGEKLSGRRSRRALCSTRSQSSMPSVNAHGENVTVPMVPQRTVSSASPPSCEQSMAAASPSARTGHSPFRISP